ncbi:MAG: T9SS type A sorting domain-containing protein [Candidatus Neomarinimicrobiota bacterium]
MESPIIQVALVPKTLDFIYVVTEEHNTSDLDYVSDNSLTLNGGSINDFVGNKANLALPNPGAEGSLGANKDIVIDNIGPSVISVSSSTNDGAYKSGGVIVITVTLNENTIVTGNPQIELETGATDGLGIYSSGSGSSTLSFNYTVDASHNSPDLAYTSTTALILNGGTIKDKVGLNADLTLPVPGQSGSLSSNKNIAIDNIAPTISTASVQDNGTLSVLADSKITFTISEGVTGAEILLESKLGDSVSGILTVDDATHVSANLVGPFISGDELTLTINKLTDYAGNVTNGSVYNYNISLIADYNVDGSIDASDLTTLINGWTSKDYSFELGPTTGDVPNLKPSLDGKFDIMDAAVLIRMWHWNLNKSGKILSRYANMGKELAYINENNTLSIQVSKDVNAVDFYFDYPQHKVSIKESKERPSDKEIMLTHLDSLGGQFVLTAGYLEQKLQSIEVPYIINGREDVTITAIYRMFNTNGEVISQGTKEITLKPVPQEFALHQNYPNPFNPLTTINYDLPQQTYVNLMIYDILGREVVKLVSEETPAGYQSVIWNTRNSLGAPVSAGIYFYQIQTKGFVKTRKMVLLK